MPKPSTMTTDVIVHAKLDHDIHLIDVHSDSRMAIAAVLNLIEDFYTMTNPPRAHFLLVDSTKYALPLATTIRQTIDLEKIYVAHAPLNAAILVNLDVAVMLDTMLRPLRQRNHIRLFAPKDRERAMQWLLARQAIYSSLSRHIRFLHSALFIFLRLAI